MAALILPHRWRQQPQGPVAVDWAHPIARKLVFAASAGEGLSVPRDVVGGRTASTTADGVLLRSVRGNGGLGYVGASADSVGGGNLGYAFGNTGAFVPDGSTPVTALALYTLGAASVTGDTPIGYGSVNAGGYALRLNATNERYFVNNGASTSVVGASTVVGAQRCLVGRATGSEVSVWGNGVKSASTSSTALPISNSNGMHIAMTGVATNAATHLALVWARALADGEIAVLAENPWQVFRPLQRRIWVAVTSGTVWNASISESADAADAAAAALAAQATIAEAATASETTVVIASVVSQLSEAVSAGDTSSALAALLATVVESPTVTDVVAVALVTVGAIAEAVSASDAVSQGGAAYPVALTEAATAADSAAAAVQLAAQLLESSAATEVLSASAVLVGALNEALAAGDLLTGGSPKLAGLAEAAVLLDSLLASTGGAPVFTAEGRARIGAMLARTQPQGIGGSSISATGNRIGGQPLRANKQRIG